MRAYGVFFISLGLAAAVVCLAGCTGGDNNSGDDQALAKVESDFAVAKSQADVLEKSLDGGMSISSALSALLTRLNNQAQVTEAVAGPDGQTVWARFESGLEHIFVVIDATLEEEDPAVLTASAASPKRLAPKVGPGPVPAQTGGWGFFNLPASKKALVANSLTVGRPLQDSTKPVKEMLEACGYDVTRVNADVELFKKLTPYGVIYIEAHGWPSPFTTPADITGSTTDMTCRSQGSTMVLQTTTAITNENLKTYVKDLVCGRLRSTSTVVRQFGPPHRRIAVYAVTANFIRKYDTGKFPDGVVVGLGSCRGFDANLNSDWYDLIIEKSKHSMFVAWTQKTHWGLSARAFLNMFQLATGSNKEVTMTSLKSGKTYWLLEKSATPVTPQPMVNAMMSLATKTKKYDENPITKGKLQWTGAATGEVSYRILAPSVVSLFVSREAKNKSLLWAYCSDNAQLRIGSTSPITLGVANAMGWTFTLEGLRSGAVTILDNGRYAPAQYLLTWKPVVTIKGTGGYGMAFTVIHRFQARAMPQAGSMGTTWTPSTLRSVDEVWNPPGQSFETMLDDDGGTVTWSVTGSGSDGQSKYQYSGGSSESLKFYNAGGTSLGTSFSSDDGKTASLAFSADNRLKYTVTATDLKTQQVTTSTAYLPYNNLALALLSLGSDWTIQSGSQADSSGGLTATISWQAITPSPAFNSATMPR